MASSSCRNINAFHLQTSQGVWSIHWLCVFLCRRPCPCWRNWFYPDAFARSAARCRRMRRNWIAFKDNGGRSTDADGTEWMIHDVRTAMVWLGSRCGVAEFYFYPAGMAPSFIRRLNIRRSPARNIIFNGRRNFWRNWIFFFQTERPLGGLLSRTRRTSHENVGWRAVILLRTSEWGGGVVRHLHLFSRLPRPSGSRSRHPPKSDTHDPLVSGCVCCRFSFELQLSGQSFGPSARTLSDPFRLSV